MYVKILLSGLMVMLTMSVSAQQIPLSTIFIENPFAFNPAIAGTDNEFRIRLNSRIQWMAFGDGPVTNTVSLYGPNAVRPMGYGANLAVDKTGPISMLKVNGSFGYNIFVSSDIRASFGLSLGFIQYKADGTLFAPSEPGDPQLPETPKANFKPDAGVGLYVYHYDWFFGLSAQQLFSNNIKFTSENGNENKLKTHFYVYGGYKQPMLNQIDLEASALARMVPSLPLQLDINVRALYNRQFWGGISVRNTFESFDDLSLIFGYIHERRISVALAYDFTFANIRKYTAGTIELVIGYNFDEVKHGR
jgi:type IX secretion system PorP/SprF family membrane protein